jgi:hypothetical protein
MKTTDLRRRKPLGITLTAALSLALLATLPACRLENGNQNQIEGLFDCSGVDAPLPGFDTTSVALRGLVFPNDELAQSFVAPRNARLRTVTLSLGRSLQQTPGSVRPEEAYLGNLHLAVDIDHNSLPADRLLSKATASGQSFRPNATNSTRAFTFTLNPPIDVRANNIYWIRLTADYPARNDLQILWQTNNSGRYDVGRSIYRNSSRWDDAALGSSRDFAFQLSCTEWPKPSPSPSPSAGTFPVPR